MELTLATKVVPKSLVSIGHVMGVLVSLCVHWTNQVYFHHHFHSVGVMEQNCTHDCMTLLRWKAIQKLQQDTCERDSTAVAAHAVCPFAVDSSHACPSAEGAFWDYNSHSSNSWVLPWATSSHFVTFEQCWALDTLKMMTDTECCGWDFVHWHCQLGYWGDLLSVVPSSAVRKCVEEGYCTLQTLSWLHAADRARIYTIPAAEFLPCISHYLDQNIGVSCCWMWCWRAWKEVKVENWLASCPHCTNRLVCHHCCCSNAKWNSLTCWLEAIWAQFHSYVWSAGGLQKSVTYDKKGGIRELNKFLWLARTWIDVDTAQRVHTPVGDIQLICAKSCLLCVASSDVKCSFLVNPCTFWLNVPFQSGHAHTQQLGGCDQKEDHWKSMLQKRHRIKLSEKKLFRKCEERADWAWQFLSTPKQSAHFQLNTLGWARSVTFGFFPSCSRVSFDEVAQRNNSMKVKVFPCKCKQKSLGKEISSTDISHSLPLVNTYLQSETSEQAVLIRECLRIQVDQGRRMKI